jgi:crossover junction endodeoxyribonuclease RuvC
MGVVIGIDPGVCGAIAVIGDGRFVCYDMPTTEINGKRRVCPAGLTISMRGIRDTFIVEMVVVEHVQGVQGTGATSAFTFGRGFGIIEGVLSALCLPHTLVRPQRWTKALGVSRDKGAHRDAASRIWPHEAACFSRVKDDGRADAALMAHWWMRHERS